MPTNRASRFRNARSACSVVLVGRSGESSTFLRETDTSRITIVRARTTDETLARQLIYRYQDKRFSFTDAISFVIMERLGIRLAFSFDRNYSQYGFSQLRT